MNNILLQLIENKKYFIFDFDGTLVDLEKLNHQSFDTAFQEILNVGVTVDEYKKYISGSGAKGGVLRLLQVKKYDEVAYIPVVKRFRTIKNEAIAKDIASTVFVKPGVDKFFSYLKERDVSIAIGTSSIHRYVDAAIEAFGWEGIFDVIITSEDVERSKPYPDIFLKTIDTLGGQKNEAIIFEDSQNGVDAARKSGMDYIVLHSIGGNDHVIVKEKYVIKNYSELILS